MAKRSTIINYRGRASKSTSQQTSQASQLNKSTSQPASQQTSQTNQPASQQTSQLNKSTSQANQPASKLADKKEVLAGIFREIEIKKGIRGAALLVDQFMHHIKYIKYDDDNLLKIYSYAYIYNQFNIKINKLKYKTEYKMQIIKNAMKEIKEWKIESKPSRWVCNLYTMKSI